MKQPIPVLLFLTLSLSACSTSVATPQTSASQTPTDPLPPPTLTSVPDTPFPSTKCGYQWAYEDLPELTTQFDRAVKNLIPESTSHASAFGENCLAPDGQVVRFLAMETDFYIELPVTNLTDFESFGNWIAHTMPVVLSLPPDMLKGQQKGFVEYRFSKSEHEFLTVRVPIQTYIDSAEGMTGEKLFRIFHTE